MSGKEKNKYSHDQRRNEKKQYAQYKKYINQYMNIIKHKTIYFVISLLVIIPGMVSLVLWGLTLSIDFTGGTRMTVSLPTVNATTVSDIKRLFHDDKAEIATIQIAGKQLIIRIPQIDQRKHNAILTDLKKKFPALREDSYETIGPVIGQEITGNAVKGIIFASLLIVLYIAWSFREVPKPASSWRFGICAIIALLHDALVVIGVFSLLGHFFRVEVDSLFVTALLTVIGFSVHDTIVVFDRIRENLKRSYHRPFPEVVNDSILQTLGRSLNTSLTVILVLVALLLFGGESTRWFIVALLVGIVSGTYSSIFNAAPLLVLWHQWSEKRSKRFK